MPHAVKCVFTSVLAGLGESDCNYVELVRKIGERVAKLTSEAFVDCQSHVLVYK